jgi:hypothetical protein
VTARPRILISGGQTGVDRGALDAALAHGLPHGGFCPRGRRAEDGVIPAIYQLTELPSPLYAVRTRRNVLASDATLVLTTGRPGRGTALTIRVARAHGRPLLVLDLRDGAAARCAAAIRIRAWLAVSAPDVLNVAGPRESSAPGIAAATRDLLVHTLSQG